MNTSKGFSRLFGILGVFFAAIALAVCLLARDAAPRLLMGSRGASECAGAMLTRLCAGDYAGASAYLYGNPKLDSNGEYNSQVTRQLWDAFTGSLEYELVGESYATVSGVAQKVVIRGMEIPSVTAGLKQRAQSLLEQRVEQAQSMAEVYDENHEYRPDFVDTVLRDAVNQAVSADAAYTERELTLNLVYDKDQWWVMPDQALLSAISGGILG